MKQSGNDDSSRVHVHGTCYWIVIAVRKRSCGKVMFSHLSVNHSVHREACLAGGACVAEGGACMAGGMCGRGHVWQGGVHGGGRDMHGNRDGHCSGRYASYWNALLFFISVLATALEKTFVHENIHWLEKLNHVLLWIPLVSRSVVTLNCNKVGLVLNGHFVLLSNIFKLRSIFFNWEIPGYISTFLWINSRHSRIVAQ